MMTPMTIAFNAKSIVFRIVRSVQQRGNRVHRTGRPRESVYPQTNATAFAPTLANGSKEYSIFILHECQCLSAMAIEKFHLFSSGCGALVSHASRLCRKKIEIGHRHRVTSDRMKRHLIRIQSSSVILSHSLDTNQNEDKSGKQKRKTKAKRKRKTESKRSQSIESSKCEVE